MKFEVDTLGLPQVPCGPQVTLNAYFSLSTHTKQLLLVTYCHTPARIEVSFRTDGTGRNRTDGQTDVEVEIVI